jgi:tetratricopeptide (TPR) repeat protein
VLLGIRRQFPEAEQAFSQAIEIDPKLMLAYRNRAFSRLSQEKFKDAEDDLTRALELGASPLQIHTYRAQVRDKLGNTTGALADRALADSLTPSHEADFISRGLTRLDAKKYRPALADFRAAEELNRRSLSALLNQVHVLADCLGEPEAALEACARLIRAYPEFASGRIDRAVLLARLGKRIDAIAEAERALKLSKDPDVTYRAACVFSLSSVVDEATKSADQARALDLLHRAIKDGTARRDRLETDRDLDAIRQTERFQEIADAVMSLYR